MSNIKRDEVPKNGENRIIKVSVPKMGRKLLQRYITWPLSP